MSSASWYLPPFFILYVPFLKSAPRNTFVTSISFNRVYHCKLACGYPEIFEVARLLRLPPSLSGDRRLTPGSKEDSKEDSKEGGEEDSEEEELLDGHNANSNSSDTRPAPERLGCNSAITLLLQ